MFHWLSSPVCQQIEEQQKKIVQDIELAYKAKDELVESLREQVKAL